MICRVARLLQRSGGFRSIGPLVVGGSFVRFEWCDVLFGDPCGTAVKAGGG